MTAPMAPTVTLSVERSLRRRRWAIRMERPDGRSIVLADYLTDSQVPRVIARLRDDITSATPWLVKLTTDGMGVACRPIGDVA